MNSSDTTANPAHGGLFVIACPLCFGHVAASAATAGQPVCCPLCAGMFVVPVPAVAQRCDQLQVAPRGGVEHHVFVE